MNLKPLSVAFSIISVAAPLFMLRAYLGYFGNAGLLTEDMANTSLLNGVWICMSLIIFVFSIIIFIPSIAFGFLVPKENNQMWNYDLLKRKSCQSLLFSTFFSLLLFFIMVYISYKFKLNDKIIKALSILLFLTGVAVINFLVFRKGVNSVAMFKHAKTKRNIKASFYLLYPSVGIFIILLNSFSLSLILESVNSSALTDSLKDYARIISIALTMCIINILPGSAFIIQHDRSTLQRNGYLTGGITLACLILLASFMTPVIPLIINRSMTFTGIADWEVRSYIINGESIPKKVFQNKEWHTEESGISNKFIVRGVMVYSLNKTKLLCPEGIKDIYRDRIHFIPWDTKYDIDSDSRLVNYARACQPFVNNDVNRLAEINPVTKKSAATQLPGS